MARKTASRTTDLLAMALVVIGGLGLGSYLTDWWSTEPEALTSVIEAVDSAVGTDPHWGVDGEPVVIGFGEHPGLLRRHTFPGSHEAALDELERQCREIVATAPVPAGPVDEAERNLLSDIEGREPVDALPGGGRVDRLGRRSGIIVGTKPFSPQPALEKGVSIPKTQRRVVSWGWALPTADTTWTLWTVQASADGGPIALIGNPDVALPPGSRRILSLRSEGAGFFAAFAGPGIPEEWSVYFDRIFSERDWTPVQPWKQNDNTWSARFVSADESSPGRADVQFYQEGPSGLTGLIHLIPTRGHP